MKIHHTPQYCLLGFVRTEAVLCRTSDETSSELSQHDRRNSTHSRRSCRSGAAAGGSGWGMRRRFKLYSRPVNEVLHNLQRLFVA